VCVCDVDCIFCSRLASRLTMCLSESIDVLSASNNERASNLLRACELGRSGYVYFGAIGVLWDMPPETGTV